MNLLFEDGECVKYVMAYENCDPKNGKMIWDPVIVVGIINFGYQILHNGEIKEVNAMDLERIDESR